ncbi:hypothetical protein AAFF_G00078290 [Aldrovandia affinis]|uniref:Uncharacterized protein n=1 Tax=Aldrovandia affinis TaxID=143900 RepID=A0AAD7WCM8_9TELE|nr:hypothetical protein AAFF_G00078290 [Aldrovandia affinis]
MEFPLPHPVAMFQPVFEVPQHITAPPDTELCLKRTAVPREMRGQGTCPFLVMSDGKRDPDAGDISQHLLSIYGVLQEHFQAL